MSYKDTRISMLKDMEGIEGFMDLVWLKMKDLADCYNNSVRIGNVNYLDNLHSDLFSKDDALLSYIRGWNKKQGFMKILKADGTVDRIANNPYYEKIKIDELYFITIPKTIPELLNYFMKYQELAFTVFKDDILERYELINGLLVNISECEKGENDNKSDVKLKSKNKSTFEIDKNEQNDLEYEYKVKYKESLKINNKSSFELSDKDAKYVDKQREARERMVKSQYVDYKVIHDRVIAGVDAYFNEYKDARRKCSYMFDYITKMLIIESLKNYPSENMRNLLNSFTFDTEDFIDCLFCKIHQYRLGMTDDEFEKELRDLTTNTNYLFRKELKTDRNGELKNPYSASKLATPLKNELIFDFLRFMVETMASHFGKIAHIFAIDASGFSLDNKNIYYDTKHRNRRRAWKDAHAICDVDSNVVTSVIITKHYELDELDAMETLIEHTQKHFRIDYLLGDGGYLNEEKLQKVFEKRGVRYYAPQRVNTNYTPNKSNPQSEDNKDFYLSEIYDRIYHQRSNIETVFSSVKTKYDESLSSTNDNGRMAETYIKFINYNIWVTILHYFSSNQLLYPDFLDKNVLEDLRATKPYTPSMTDIEHIEKALSKVGKKRNKQDRRRKDNRENIKE